MKTIADFNPIVQTLYFLSAALCSMLGMNPVMIVISLVGALLLYILRAEDEKPTGHLFTLLLFAVTALINPLFYHNGATVLLVINNNPITLEATLYGITAGAMIISVLYHFRSFSKIMTSDRLMYVFGKLSGKFALTLAMTLRYIPLFITQMERVRAAQRTTGQYKDGSIADTVKSDLRVFSVMITWALENGIVTADSMEARGYGTGKRTSFALWRMRRRDVIFLLLILLLVGLQLPALLSGALTFTFYPNIRSLPTSPAAILAYISYGALVLTPSAIECIERAKWKYFVSKI